MRKYSMNHSVSSFHNDHVELNNSQTIVQPGGMSQWVRLV